MDLDSWLYQVFSVPPNPLVGHRPRPELYRRPEFPLLSGGGRHENDREGFILEQHDDPDSRGSWGRVRVPDDQSLHRGKFINGQWMVDIAFTAMGDRGPLLLFIHGVPSNRKSYYPVMNRLKSFCRCLAIDLLGMGQSQVDRQEVAQRYEEYGADWPYQCWLWRHDVEYIRQVMETLYPQEHFILVGDDWAGGSAIWYATTYPDSLLAFVLLDPVALDGYPVSEIQAIGRTSPLLEDQFKQAMGDFDQKAIQIYKTMVHQPDHVINQYTYRWIQETYVDVDYGRGFSSTMNLNWNNLRNLADRAYVLGAPQLLPYDKTENPYGVVYSSLTTPSLILWGSLDNMMPEMQRHRLRYLIKVASSSRVQTRQIPETGHFAIWDSPDLVSSMILDYLLENYPAQDLADVFLGFNETRIWKGDEKVLLENLRRLLYSRP